MQTQRANPIPGFISLAMAVVTGVVVYAYFVPWLKERQANEAKAVEALQAMQERLKQTEARLANTEDANEKERLADKAKLKELSQKLEQMAEAERQRRRDEALARNAAGPKPVPAAKDDPPDAGELERQELIVAKKLREIELIADPVKRTFRLIRFCEACEKEGVLPTRSLIAAQDLVADLEKHGVDAFDFEAIAFSKLALAKQAPTLDARRRWMVEIVKQYGDTKAAQEAIKEIKAIDKPITKLVPVK